MSKNLLKIAVEKIFFKLKNRYFFYIRIELFIFCLKFGKKHRKSKQILCKKSFKPVRYELSFFIYI